jgi:hypothetical protein
MTVRMPAVEASQGLNGNGLGGLKDLESGQNALDGLVS